MTTFAAHQPHYGPWVPYLWKMANCDVFVVADDFDFKRHDWQAKTRVRGSDGELVLTVPVHRGHEVGRPINELRVVEESAQAWRVKHRHTLMQQYGMSWPTEGTTLCEVAMGTIEWLRKQFKIETPLVFTSQMGLTATGSERVAQIGEVLGADTYLCSPVGVSAYLDVNAMPFKIVTYQYTPPIPGYRFSAIDMLSHLGSIELWKWCSHVQHP